MRKLLIIIPAWNEHDALPGVLREITETSLDADILVVDDGSEDNTSDIALAAGAEVLTLPVNLGVGGAMRAGYVYAARKAYPLVVQVDADGQHKTADIPRLIQQMKDTGSDIVIGARFADKGNYPVHGPRSWAMKLLAWQLSKFCKTHLTDSTSGFKLTNPKATSLFAREMPAEYLGDTIEALVIASKAGLRITQVGVEMRERQAGEPSHTPLKSAIFLFRAVIAMGVAATRPTIERAKDANISL